MFSKKASYHIQRGNEKENRDRARVENESLLVNDQSASKGSARMCFCKTADSHFLFSSAHNDAAAASPAECQKVFQKRIAIHRRQTTAELPCAELVCMRSRF